VKGRHPNAAAFLLLDLMFCRAALDLVGPYEVVQAPLHASDCEQASFLMAACLGCVKIPSKSLIPFRRFQSFQRSAESALRSTDNRSTDNRSTDNPIAVSDNVLKQRQPGGLPLRGTPVARLKVRC
jgi:hypothetical protein